jgi:hypothetical protein
VPESRSRGSGGLVIFGVAILLNLLLTVLVLDQVGRNRDEVKVLAEKLATRQDIAMLRPLRVTEILDQRCTSCHTDRRFAATRDMTEREILDTVARMSSHPGADIPPAEFRRIESALLLFRCTSCHEETVLSRLVLMSGEERYRFLRKKLAMPGSGFRPDQLGLVAEAFKTLSMGGGS